MRPGPSCSLTPSFLTPAVKTSLPHLTLASLIGCTRLVSIMAVRPRSGGEESRAPGRTFIQRPSHALSPSRDTMRALPSSHRGSDVAGALHRGRKMASATRLIQKLRNWTSGVRGAERAALGVCGLLAPRIHPCILSFTLSLQALMPRSPWAGTPRSS